MTLAGSARVRAKVMAMPASSCFVSSGNWGKHMTRDDIAGKVLPRLLQARVELVTLTGGEPFAHPDLLAICDAVLALGLSLGVCTNATLASDEQIAHLARSGAVHVNVSFDGFRPESHGKLRGSVSSFATTLATTRKFAAAGMLQGLLSTPNMLTEPGEFADGLTAVCPYLVFAARTPQSAYPDSDFLVGNILDGEIADALDRYDLAGRLAMGANDTCSACAIKGICGKGCPAALISRGQQIGEVDTEQCPIVPRPLLQIGRRPR
jgi:radical SAM protein with 4Fe4S-binding SPASM domain